MEVPVQLHPIIFGILVLCDVVYLCQFEGYLECISLGIFGLIIQFGFDGGTRGPADEINYPVQTCHNQCHRVPDNYVLANTTRTSMDAIYH